MLRYLDEVRGALSRRCASSSRPSTGRSRPRQGPVPEEEITDSALEMAQRLVRAQADFLRKVVDSAGKS